MYSQAVRHIHAMFGKNASQHKQNQYFPRFHLTQCAYTCTVKALLFSPTHLKVNACMQRVYECVCVNMCLCIRVCMEIHDSMVVIFSPR